MNPYWLLRAFVKAPNISHAATTGLESAGKKWPNPTMPEFIENLLTLFSRHLNFSHFGSFQILAVCV